jgi:hypothetical protein
VSDLPTLIAENVGEPFGLFFCTGEGSFFPNGEEESSGMVVTRSGRHFGFWTGWDYEQNCLTLDQWYVDLDDESRAAYAADAEYLDAVAEASGDATARPLEGSARGLPSNE